MTNFWLLNPIELSLTNKTGYKTIFFALSGAHNTPNTAHRSYLPNLHKKSFPTKISLTTKILEFNFKIRFQNSIPEFNFKIQFQNSYSNSNLKRERQLEPEKWIFSIILIIIRVD